MVRYENIEAINMYTDGFEVSQLEPLSLTVSSGTLNIVREDGSLKIYSFPSFQFPVECDHEFETSYDIYLLTENDPETGVNVHVDRTELALDTIYFYEGKTPLLHVLSSFKIPPNTDSLDNIDIGIRNIYMKEETK